MNDQREAFSVSRPIIVMVYLPWTTATNARYTLQHSETWTTVDVTAGLDATFLTPTEYS